MKTPKKRKPARKKPASKRSEDHARITWALGGGAAGGGGIGGNGTRWTSTSVDGNVIIGGGGGIGRASRDDVRVAGLSESGSSWAPNTASWTDHRGCTHSGYPPAGALWTNGEPFEPRQTRAKAANPHRRTSYAICGTQEWIADYHRGRKSGETKGFTGDDAHMYARGFADGCDVRDSSQAQAVRIGRDVVFAALGAAIAMLLTAWLQP